MEVRIKEDKTFMAIRCVLCVHMFVVERERRRGVSEGESDRVQRQRCRK